MALRKKPKLNSFPRVKLSESEELVRAAEQAAGNLTPAPAPVPAATPQHPGWIWDAQSNQWVADPNYQPPQQ